jgi:hypothetical protein
MKEVGYLSKVISENGWAIYQKSSLKGRAD